jgi:hypothetical protein
VIAPASRHPQRWCPPEATTSYFTGDRIATNGDAGLGRPLAPKVIASLALRTSRCGRSPSPHCVSACGRRRPRRHGNVIAPLLRAADEAGGQYRRALAAMFVAHAGYDRQIASVTAIVLMASGAGAAAPARAVSEVGVLGVLRTGVGGGRPQRDSIRSHCVRGRSEDAV